MTLLAVFATDEQRRRLALKAQAPSVCTLKDLGPLVTPDALGRKIGRTTVRRILAQDGIEPAPDVANTCRGPRFMKAHWGAIAALDFFKVEVMTLTGPVRYAVLVVMDLNTRHVEVPGIVREACSPAAPQPQPERLH